MEYTFSYNERSNKCQQKKVIYISIKSLISEMEQNGITYYI